MGLFKKEKIEGGFNSQHVNVVIEKELNKGIYKEVAEFIAEQDKSEAKSLVIKNFEYDFVEELDFKENDIISALKESYAFKNKTKEEKLELLSQEISKQAEKLSQIKDGYWHKKVKTGKKVKNDKGKDVDEYRVEKVMVNRIDEDRKLRLLKVLKQHVQDYDERGAYEIINIRGLREIRFLAIGDFLFPLYRSPNNMTIYPNMVTQKKVYKVQRDLAVQEFNESTTSKFMNFLEKAKPLISTILIIVCIIWSINLGMREADLQDKIREEIKSYQNMMSKQEQELTKCAARNAFFMDKITTEQHELFSYANQQMSIMTDYLNNSITGEKGNSLREDAIRKTVDDITGNVTG